MHRVYGDIFLIFAQAATLKKNSANDTVPERQPSVYSGSERSFLMQQAPVSSCDCCGLPLAAGMGEDCPRCHYPIQPAKEEHFLESAIHDLQRVATHGGAYITVAALIHRYRLRLAYLRQLKMSASLASVPMPPAGQAFAATDPSTLPIGSLPEMAISRPPASTAHIMGPALPPTPMLMPTAPAREPRTVRQTFFSWTAFFIDNAITVIGLLGAFLVLLGTLSFVYNNTIIQSGNRLESFLIVFGAHIAFGIVGLIASRFANFRLIARIYIIICALLLPLAGLTGYSLILGHLITLSVPTLIAIAAVYTTIIYGLLAVYQDSVLFGYLAAVALVVADLATAQALGLGYWWWPSTLMLLALLTLISVVQPSSASNGRSNLNGHLAILREPMRVLMFSIPGISALGIAYVALYSILLDITGHMVREIHISILSMALLCLLWTSLYIRLTRNTKFLLALAYLFLACVLAFCYSFNFGHIGYALVLTGAAVLYHGLGRFAHRLLQPLHNLALHVDQLAILIVCAVPLISEPWLPFQLFLQVYSPSPRSVSLQTLLTSWEIVGPFIVVAVSFLLTISIVFGRADARAASGRGNAWPWLLLLSGVLLNWEYGEVVLTANVMSFWWFLGLTLALTVSAIVVRQRAGAYWANPLDTLAIGEAILTLILMLNQPDSLWIILLFFAALSYGILLYQRRQNGLFLPLTFASFALLTLTLIPHKQVILFLGIALPFVAAAVSHFMPTMPAFALPANSTDQRSPIISFGWEWPLLAIALTSGIIVACFDLISSTSTLQNWLHTSVPVAFELATFSLVWYVYAVLSRAKWCLLPMTGFALAALVLPSNGFPVLLATTCIVAALAFSISHIKGKDWALPLYLVALFAAVMTGISGHTQNHLAATCGVLLVFAVLAYIIGIVEGWAAASWLLPVFVTWSLFDATVLLGDLWRPPIIALLCPVASLAISRSKLFSSRHYRFTNYVLPLYTTALVAAALTGIYGMFKGINVPFYGAVPDALFLYAALAYIVLFLERQPKAQVVPLLLVIWAIGETHGTAWQLAIGYSLLCVFAFVSQFIWELIPFITNQLSSIRLYRVCALAGQALVVLSIILLGGPFASDVALAHVGAGALFVLALLLCWYGRLQHTMVAQSRYYYWAGLLLSLIVPWELVIFKQTNLNLLTLAPAVYLSVIGQLLMREGESPARYQAGQIALMLGSTLLLVPTLWLSFSVAHQELLYTLVLLGEALVLLLLGIGRRTRMLALYGAGLIIVGGLHALFLTTNSTPLALVGLGLILVLIATGLTLTRHKLQALWTHWQ
jgi:hypothetical protein